MGSLKNALWTVMFGLGFICDPVWAQTESAKIPEAFHGNWYGQQENCEAIMSGPIYVFVNGYEEGEHSAFARDIKIISPTEADILFDLYGEMTSESTGDAYAGQVWHRFTLIDQGQTLKITVQVDAQKYESLNKRCPNLDNPEPVEEPEAEGVRP